MVDEPSPENQQNQQPPISGDETPAQPAEPQPPRMGQFRVQDSSTQPRPPTLAEERARERAEQEALAAEQAAAAEAQRKAKIRKRVLIGGGVTVGLVALVGGWYALSQPSSVVAHCTDSNGVIVDSQYCDTNSAYYISHHGFLNPAGIFILGGSQYHYYYGGNSSIGQRATGGSLTKPDNANITDSKGKTIQRGGFGVKGGGDSGGSAGKGGSGSESGGS